MNNVVRTTHETRLQAQIDDAAVGSVVHIESPGEYRGPFVIHKPLTLVGRGRLTPLWRREGVVLLITAPGVVLKNVAVEIIHQPGANDLMPVMHLEGCTPTFDNSLMPAVEESYLMSERNFIHLGTVRTTQNLLLPFELDSNFPFNHLGKLPPYLIPAEPRHNRHGARAFWLNINLSNEPGYIMDTLTLGSENGSNAQYLINGHVVDAPPAEKRFMLKVLHTPGRIRNVYATSGMLELSEEQISLITGGQVSRGRSLCIFTDADGHDQFIWLPFQTVRNAVTYDDVRLHGWKRYPLQAGKRLALKQGDLEFEVAPFTNFTLQITPGGLEFGEVTQVGARIKLEIKNNQGLIQSGLGLIKRQVTITPLVNWLTVSESVLRLDRGGTEIFVEVNRNILDKTSAQTILEPSALAVYDDNDIFFLPARVQIKLPDYAMMLENTILTFASTNGKPIYAGEIEALDVVGTLINSGKEPASVEVVDKPEWIIVSQNIGDVVKPGERMAFALRMVPEKANEFLSDGIHKLPEVIRLRCRENGQILPITIKITVQPARIPNVRIENANANPRLLNLDAVERREYRKGENSYDQVYRRVRLKNHGLVEGRYRLMSSHPADIFKDSQPANKRAEVSEFIGVLPPGGEDNVHVFFPAHVFKNEAEGSTLDVRIDVETSKNGTTFTRTGSMVIPVNVTRLTPAASLSKQTLQLSPMIQNQDLKFEEAITLKNTGTDLFEGAIVVHPQYKDYLRILPVTEFRLQQGEILTFKVEATRHFSTMSPRRYDVPDIITINRTDLRDTADKSKVQLATISMSWVIERPDPLPYLHTKTLYFGRAEVGLEKNRPVLLNENPLKRELVIGNYGYAPYIAQFKINAPWLDTIIADGEIVEIPPQMVLRLPITVNQQIMDHTLGPVYNVNGIEVQAQDESTPSFIIPVRILVSRLKPPISAEPAIVHLGAITSGQRLPVEYMNAQFYLQNSGKLDWYITDAGTQRNYITFEPVPHVIPRQSKSDPITVKWNDIYPSPTQNTPTTEEDLITFRDENGQMVNIRVQYVIHPVHVRMYPEHLELQLNPTLGNRVIGVRRTEQQQTVLEIHNLGGAPFLVKRRDASALTGGIDGNLVLPPGLLLEPSIEEGFAIPPGEKQVFRVYAPDPSQVGDGNFAILLNLPDSQHSQLRSFIEIKA